MLEEDRKNSDNTEKTIISFQQTFNYQSNNINEISLKFVEDKDSNISLKKK